MLLSTQAPYSTDGLIILLGLFLFRWRSRFTPFVGALILTETFLRSVYDVAINYSLDAIFGGVGDFRFLLSGTRVWPSKFAPGSSCFWACPARCARSHSPSLTAGVSADHHRGEFASFRPRDDAIKFGRPGVRPAGPKSGFSTSSGTLARLISYCDKRTPWVEKNQCSAWNTRIYWQTSGSAIRAIDRWRRRCSISGRTISESVTETLSRTILAP